MHGYVQVWLLDVDSEFEGQTEAALLGAASVENMYELLPRDELRIWSFSHTSLPDSIGNLTVLRALSIGTCTEMSSLPKDDHPACGLGDIVPQ